MTLEILSRPVARVYDKVPSQDSIDVVLVDPT